MTDQEFEAIVTDATKRIEGNIRWEEHPQHAGVQEFRVRIHSDAGYPLFLIGRYNDAMGEAHLCDNPPERRAHLRA